MWYHVISREITWVHGTFLFFFQLKLIQKLLFQKGFIGRWFRIIQFPVDPAYRFFRISNENRIYREIKIEWTRLYSTFFTFFASDRFIELVQLKSKNKNHLNLIIWLRNLRFLKLPKRYNFEKIRYFYNVFDFYFKFYWKSV